jgi:hypothetical protein
MPTALFAREPLGPTCGVHRRPVWSLHSDTTRAHMCMVESLQSPLGARPMPTTARPAERMGQGRGQTRRRSAARTSHHPSCLPVPTQCRFGASSRRSVSAARAPVAASQGSSPPPKSPARGVGSAPPTRHAADGPASEHLLCACSPGLFPPGRAAAGRSSAPCDSTVVPTASGSQPDGQMRGWLEKRMLTRS